MALFVFSSKIIIVTLHNACNSTQGDICPRLLQFIECMGPLTPASTEKVSEVSFVSVVFGVISFASWTGGGGKNLSEFLDRSKK